MEESDGSVDPEAVVETDLGGEETGLSGEEPGLGGEGTKEEEKADIETVS